MFCFYVCVLKLKVTDAKIEQLTLNIAAADCWRLKNRSLRFFVIILFLQNGPARQRRVPFLEQKRRTNKKKHVRKQLGWTVTSSGAGDRSIAGLIAIPSNCMPACLLLHLFSILGEDPSFRKLLEHFFSVPSGWSMVNSVVGQILIQVTCVTTPSTPDCVIASVHNLLFARGHDLWSLFLEVFEPACRRNCILFVSFLFSVKNAWLCALSLEQWLLVCPTRINRNGCGVKQGMNRAA